MSEKKPDPVPATPAPATPEPERPERVFAKLSDLDALRKDVKDEIARSTVPVVEQLKSISNDLNVIAKGKLDEKHAGQQPAPDKGGDPAGAGGKGESKAAGGGVTLGDFFPWWPD